MTEIISFRADDKLRAMIYTLVREKDISVTIAIKNILDIGLQYYPHVSEAVDKYKEFYIMAEALKMADLDLKQKMKIAYLLKNFQKLMSDLKHERIMSEEHKETIKKSALERIKIAFGEDSKEFMEAKDFLRKDKGLY